MHRSGVETSGVETVAGPTGVAMVWVDRDGRNKIAVASGANGRLAPSAVERMSISPADTLVLQMEVPSGTIVAAIARAKAAGARVVLNLAPARPLPVEVLRQVDILVVNEVEAAELGQVLGLEIADHSARTVALAERLGITIVTTLGADGAVAAVKGGVTHRVPALPVKAVDTTGAGDCFVGVLTAALDRNLALPDAMRRAASAASLACTVLGAEPSFPSRDATDAALARVAPRAG
jgi:ribokinase